MRITRWLAVGCVASGLLLGGCKREPDFDARYDAASQKIVQKAKQIDAQIAGAGTSSTDAEEDTASQ